MRPFPPKDLKVSTKPIAVKGFTIPEAAEESGTSASISKVTIGLEIAYSAHAPPVAEAKITLLPIHSLRLSLPT